jgi:hypothetical protein
MNYSLVTHLNLSLIALPYEKVAVEPLYFSVINETLAPLKQLDL